MTGASGDRDAAGGSGGAEQPPSHDEELVDEAVEESFPASDPPSWEPLHSGAPQRGSADRGATDDRGSATAGLGGAAFGAHLAGLEERVAAADARGESVPAEARAMIAHLREIVDALDGLTASLGRRAAPPPPSSQPPSQPPSGGAEGR